MQTQFKVHCSQQKEKEKKTRQKKKAAEGDIKKNK